MKPEWTVAMKRQCVTGEAGGESPLSLQEELVAAIHGAFELAVQIAVREVKRLLGDSTGDAYERMRRENESLKQRLKRAEAILDAARPAHREGRCSAPWQTSSATKQPDPAPHHTSPKAKVGQGIRGESPSASLCEEQKSDFQAGTRIVSDPASELGKGQNNASAKEDTEEMSPLCVVKVESLQEPCQDSTPESLSEARLASNDGRSTLEQVTVKEEHLYEMEGGGSVCRSDPVKIEDLISESMSAVQSKMSEECEPELPDIQSEDPNVQLSCTRPARGIQPTTDLPSLSSEFPIFQLPEPAPISEARSQIHGVQVRTTHNLGNTIANLYSCKFCHQIFHLPSLLQRHHNQCPQKLQQCCPQPAAASKRNRLQLYPPGCSPFRCTECNKEFNRMENLKTHLRIHTGERPYTCSVCSKCFRHSGALTRHFRIHTGEKPYICGKCGKTFRNCGGLKFHQSSHSK